jgi:hypothetical protein
MSDADFEVRPRATDFEVCLRRAAEVTLAAHMRWPQTHTLDAGEAAMWKVRRDELCEEIARLQVED